MHVHQTGQSEPTPPVGYLVVAHQPIFSFWAVERRAGRLSGCSVTLVFCHHQRR
jgi:hypothetical protein